MKYPNKLSFSDSHTGRVYDLTKVSFERYRCDDQGEPDVNNGSFTVEQIEKAFADGHWKEISSSEPEERGMVFPLTCNWVQDSHLYTFDREPFTGKIICTWDGGNRLEYQEDMLRDAIKKGDCLVRSVGPQKAPEVATSASKGFTLSVDSEQLVEATERANELAQAVENVNIALESFQAIIKDFNVNVEVV